MAEDFFQGYWGASLEVLKKYNCRVWSQAECQTTGGLFKGTILPRAAFQDDQHIVMKVNTGYNIGVDISTITGMVETDYKKANYHIPEKEFPYTEGLPHVKLLGTGGTIASRLDYRTGAVIPAFSPGELYGAVPELADICRRHRHRPRHRHAGPHRRRPDLHVPEPACADCLGRLTAFIGPSVIRRRLEPDARHDGCRSRRRGRGDGLHVWSHLRRVWLPAPGHACA